MKSDNVWPFVSDFFHSLYCTTHPCVAGVCPLCLLGTDGVPLAIQTTFGLASRWTLVASWLEFLFSATVHNAVLPEQVFVQAPVFCSSGHRPTREIARLHGNSMVNFLGKCHTVFHGSGSGGAGASPAFPPAVHQSSGFSTPSPMLVIVCLFDYSHPSRCEVAHCGKHTVRRV